MRLWHKNLIPLLPRLQLLSQHRECAALRGLGWGKNHSTVNYVFKHTLSHLVYYHYKVMSEMESRGYKVNQIWKNPRYRGKRLPELEDNMLLDFAGIKEYENEYFEYPEHDIKYYWECVENLVYKIEDDSAIGTKKYTLEEKSRIFNLYSIPIK